MTKRYDLRQRKKVVNFHFLKYFYKTLCSKLLFSLFRTIAIISKYKEDTIAGLDPSYSHTFGCYLYFDWWLFDWWCWIVE